MLMQREGNTILICKPYILFRSVSKVTIRGIANNTVP